jgi:hypothetical protein
MYPWAMKIHATESRERLIRVRAKRRGVPVELLVHFERASLNGCDIYRLFSVEDANKVPVPIDSARS